MSQLEKKIEVTKGKCCITLELNLVVGYWVAQGLQETEFMNRPRTSAKLPSIGAENQLT